MQTVDKGRVWDVINFTIFIVMHIRILNYIFIYIYIRHDWSVPVFESDNLSEFVVFKN